MSHCVGMREENDAERERARYVPWRGYLAEKEIEAGFNKDFDLFSKLFLDSLFSNATQVGWTLANASKS